MEWKSNRQRNDLIKKLLIDGDSINNIAKIVGCSKSTVHYYSKQVDNNHNNIVKKRIKNNAINASKCANDVWSNKRQLIVNKAIKEWPSIKLNPDMMLFLGLYWGEGTKRNGHISIVNNDPGVIKISYNIIKNYGKIETIVRCYPDHNKNICKNFWENLLNINDVKIKDKKWLGKKRKTWSKYGICTIRTSNMNYYIKILTWISLLRKESTNIDIGIDHTKSISRSGLFDASCHSDH